MPRVSRHKTETINVRLARDRKQAIIEAAAAADESISEFVIASCAMRASVLDQKRQRKLKLHNRRG